jgi:hypothetical protein
MAKRGQLTEAIKQKSMELLGVEITQRELRLMPFVQYCAVNDRFINRGSINAEERDILSKWAARGFGEFTSHCLDIEKKFWDAMSEIIWLAYVVYDAQEEAKP